uniref:DUF427 domain-containing protein n=1 Tax=Caulobacter sp. (strain K31) TaxID=366602 RepID=B0T5F2_CAUSK
MNTPNPDHPISCSREAGRVEVLFEGHEIADSADVLVLKEADYAPVRYFPRSDVAMDFLRKTDKVTHCPHKGQATYYTIHRDAKIIENAVWSYESPPPGLGQLAGRLAFYPEHVEFKRAGLTPAETRALDVDEVVRHTDSGSGASQAEHWTPNVSMPDDTAWEGDDIRDDSGPESPARPYQGTGSI